MKISIPQFQKLSRKIFGHKFVSIRTKFIHSLILLIVLFGSINLYVSYSYVIRMNKSEMQKKTSVIFNVISDQLSNALIHNDIVFNHKLIHGIEIEDPDILYIVIMDKDYQIITHTFEQNKIPEYIVSYVPTTSVSSFVDAKQKLYIRQYNYQILNGELGHLLVGLNESNTIEKGKRIVLILCGTIIALVILGIIAAYVLSTFITYPIFQIIKGVIHHDGDNAFMGQ
jgi:hypothetical protein